MVILAVKTDVNCSAIKATPILDKPNVKAIIFVTNGIVEDLTCTPLMSSAG